MTDFLSRLVDRVLGQAPVAKPLIAPQFAQGAEIFGPDATPFTVTQTESYMHGDEQAFDTISSDARLNNSSRFVEGTESLGLKREEAESGQQPSREQQPAKARITPTPRSEVEEDLTLSLLPVTSPATEQKPQQHGEVSQLIRKPVEAKPADAMRKDEVRKGIHPSEKEDTPDRSTKGSTRLEIRSTEQQESPTPDPGSYSDTEEKLTSSPLSDHAAENPPASLARRGGEPISLTSAPPPIVVSRASETKPPPHRAEARDLPTDIEPLQSEKEALREIAQQEVYQQQVSPREISQLEAPQREVSRRELSQQETSLLISKPAGAMRKDKPVSEREPSSVKNTKDSAKLEARSTEQQESVILRPDSIARQIERPSSAHPPHARVTKQRASNQYSDNQGVKSADGKKPPARQAAFVSVEGVVPPPAVPVEYDSGESRVVRPERITPQARADSPLRATIANTRPNPQTAPTIKVTIGRIEVRAVLPPALPVQETALPAPRMSLDDYLKSVSGERR